jgi:hypothetical protein
MKIVISLNMMKNEFQNTFFQHTNFLNYEFIEYIYLLK